MRRLILLRHGQTDYNATRRLQGQLDTTLSDVGVAQARAAAERAKGLGVIRIVSSDLVRARRTAEIVAEALGLGVSLDARLRETHLGDWQGKTHAEVDSWREGIRDYWRNNPGWAPPSGESRLDVARRARPVVDELMDAEEKWDGAAVLLVAHGGTISALTSNLLDLGEAQYPLFKGLNNTATSQLAAVPASGGEPGSVTWYLEAWNRELGR
ncbi:histidine phosphatase family protein [Corynebacterium liangguodongii]|uniref:Histidine phosphatase family protein n=1 Tax=Corynebacterium liangguodongii TaxID=2079535 RepID=A0A2S0WFQ6_9CORY|nr:histidine phosphatase family protein [Corynebacterium liangguodongii]AWB84502.1 histidine phosphatase family protein [Corynebacterium liangguodongii]PWB98720.1 histidine phosphatase family protein [Corynebacterium liangguodongii]